MSTTRGRCLVLALQVSLALAPLACSHKPRVPDGGADAATSPDAPAGDATSSPDVPRPPDDAADSTSAADVGSDAVPSTDVGLEARADAPAPTCVLFLGPDAGADAKFESVPHEEAPDAGDALPPLAVPLDPSFDGTPAGVWTLDPCATLDGTTGHVEMLPSCVGRPTVKQIIALPPVSATGPRAAILRMSTVSASSAPLPQGCYSNVSVAASGLQLFLGSSIIKGDQAVCLGEAATGNVAFTAELSSLWGGCGQAPTARTWLERLAIVASPSCPAPGTIPNGDFETDANWSAGAKILAGIGDGCSGGLALRSRPSGAEVTGQVSPPSSLGQPALSLRYHGAGTESLTVQLSGLDLGVLPPTKGDAFVTTRLCLPEWSKGRVQTLKLSLPQESDGNDASAYVVDDLTFVSDATCAARPLVLNGDFERTDGGGWTFAPEVPSPTTTPTGLVVGAATAHAGNGAGVLTSGICDDVTLQQTVTVPPAGVGDGTAVRFFYKYPGGTHTTLRLPTTGQDLPATPTWVQKTICLYPPPGYYTSTLVEFDLRGVGGMCQVNLATDTFSIDDVEIIRAPGCPLP